MPHEVSAQSLLAMGACKREVGKFVKAFGPSVVVSEASTADKWARYRRAKLRVMVALATGEAPRHSDLPTSAEGARGGASTSGGLGGGAQ